MDEQKNYIKITCGVEPHVLRSFELLAAKRNTTKNDLFREAFGLYLSHNDLIDSATNERFLRTILQKKCTQFAQNCTELCEKSEILFQIHCFSWFFVSKNQQKMTREEKSAIFGGLISLLMDIKTIDEAIFQDAIKILKRTKNKELLKVISELSKAGTHAPPGFRNNSNKNL